MREQPFFHANHKDRGKFQALGGVQSHQRHPVIFYFRIINIGNQGQRSQKVFQRGIFLALFKVSGHADKFLEVFNTAFVFRLVLFLEFTQISRFIQHLFD